ncbi:pirin family protein [Hymenobacter sp. 5516J-16]|nr:pirin family protein [Hymenobacter sp. 5516J-16]UOQ75523.1 pirin family protein [Hymenobacter sp. 5516J-16]
MLDLVIDARQAALSPGFEVRRILPYRLRRMLGPFIFMDHAGPVNFAPEKLPELDVLPHPHIGLSTVSYLFGGRSRTATASGWSKLFGQVRSTG